VGLVAEQSDIEKLMVVSSSHLRPSMTKAKTCLTVILKLSACNLQLRMGIIGSARSMPEQYLLFCFYVMNHLSSDL
jgi:hypothetical protein